MKIKIFLSYSTKDKELAGDIKYVLETWGQDVFLAHEDIKPSTKWVARIRKELNACPVFIALLTRNFRGSKWTDQESGIAMAKNRIIIPVIKRGNPHGFMGKYQKLTLNTDLQITCFEIMKTISGHRKLKINLENSLIEKFGKSQSYIETSKNFDFLLSFDRFTNRQVEKIVRYAMSNDQIYEYISVKSRLDYLVKKNKKKIKPEILQKFDGFLKSNSNPSQNS